MCSKCKVGGNPETCWDSKQDEPSDLMQLLDCPFCGKQPEQYTIGARLTHGEKGTKMVRCKTGSCGLWGYAMQETKWQTRAI